MDQMGSSDHGRLIRVQIKEIDGSIRRAALRLSVSDVTTNGRLRVTLTNDVIEDSSGEVTYYQSCLTDEDYRRFREEQGLLVDIHGFSAMVERMVDQAEADESGSRFFTALEIANGNEASLVFVEINTFKRLIHLRLKMTSGSDKEITNHLAGQLRHLRNSLVDVTNQNAQTKSDLIQRNSDVHTLHQQLEALRSSVNEKEASLASNLNQQLAVEKERLASEMSSARVSWNAERQRIIDENSNSTRRLQNQVASLEYENKDLIERRHRNEASLLTLTDEVKRGQAEIQKLNQEIHSVRAESNRAGEGAKELDQTVHRLQAQVSALEQDNVRLSGELSLKSEILKTSLDDKAKAEQLLVEKTQLVAKRETAVKAVSQELVKANETIKKLQSEIRRHNDKVKLSQKIVGEQEKLISKKEAELEDTRTQLRDQSEANREWLASKDLMSRELEAKDAEIDQLRRTGKTSDTVIQWLNKQLTAAKVRDPGLKIGPPPSSLVGGATMSPHSAVLPSLLGTPGPTGATSKHPGKSMVASTPLPGGPANDHPSDEENHSANPALDPKYLQPSKGLGNSVAKKTSAKKSTFSPKQTPVATKGSKLPGQRATFAESVYFS